MRELEGKKKNAIEAKPSNVAKSGTVMATKNAIDEKTLKINTTASGKSLAAPKPTHVSKGVLAETAKKNAIDDKSSKIGPSGPIPPKTSNAIQGENTSNPSGQVQLTVS